MNIAQHRLRHSAEFPYDAPQDFWSAVPPESALPPPAKDWAHAAARGVIADLLDRRGIKWPLEELEHETKVELTASLADIIREAHKQAF